MFAGRLKLTQHKSALEAQQQEQLLTRNLNKVAEAEHVSSRLDGKSAKHEGEIGGGKC